MFTALSTPSCLCFVLVSYSLRGCSRRLKIPWVAMKRGYGFFPLNRQGRKAGAPLQIARREAPEPKVKKSNAYRKSNPETIATQLSNSTPWSIATPPATKAETSKYQQVRAKNWPRQFSKQIDRLVSSSFLPISPDLPFVSFYHR